MPLPSSTVAPCAPSAASAREPVRRMPTRSSRVSASSTISAFSSSLSHVVRACISVLRSRRSPQCTGEPGRAENAGRVSVRQTHLPWDRYASAVTAGMVGVSESSFFV